MAVQLPLESSPSALHPFPARMAPEIAFDAIKGLPSRSIVVDPMCGSGVVLRKAVQLGHKAIGFDVDPLSVLMSKVWTQSLSTTMLMEQSEAIIKEAQLYHSNLVLPWIDEDEETSNFTKFWFAECQREPLRRLAYILSRGWGPINDALRIALSRTIVTKKVGASVAWDVSHSRPHRKKTDNNYDVFGGFAKAVTRICLEISKIPSDSDSRASFGDAKHLPCIPAHHADMVLSSPPYFNAIDYMRGHRLALVWLGYRLSELRRLRTLSLGNSPKIAQYASVGSVLGRVSLPTGIDKVTRSHVEQYILDLMQVMQEIIRMLKPEGRVVLVVGSSNIRGSIIDNPGLTKVIGESLGLEQIDCIDRQIPNNRRYLPPPSLTVQESLQKRMRSESVLTFVKR